MDFEIRKLKTTDIDEKFFETLANLKREDLNEDVTQAKKVFNQIKDNPVYNIFTAFNNDREVIGLATLLVEQKFIRDFAKAGHVEDVVVRKEYERQGIGKALLLHAIDFAKEKGCYRITLFCKDQNTPFYEKLGFKLHEGKTMILRF